jgi:ketosteroid isomerase-like protein
MKNIHGLVSRANAKNVADVEALRKRGREWDAAIAAKDIDRVMAFFTPESHTLPDRAPAAYGLDGIRQVWEQVLSYPGLVFITQDLVIEVADSGDLAYVLGAVEFSFDSNGQRITDFGKYALVYRKVESEWKLAFDMSNSNQAMQ